MFNKYIEINTSLIRISVVINIDICMYVKLCPKLRVVL